MSVLIKGMAMPERCWDCDLCYDTFYCKVLEVQFSGREDSEPSERRLSDCPLVPVPAHGDLIDKKTVSDNLASVLNKKNPPFSYPDWNDAIVAMLTAPTIIPAEEGET